MIFKVKPFCTKTGNFAPALYVDVMNDSFPEKEAEAGARELSGLSRFENWNFRSHITKVRQK